MRSLPSGTVTFLFTDIENSTSLWEKYPETMKSALAKHDALLKKAIESNNGQVIKTTGDGVHAAFSTVMDSVNAALDAQRDFQNSEIFKTPEFSLRIRMGLHTGEAELRDGDYYGGTLNRAARIMSIGHGGQILISETTRQIAQEHLSSDISILDLGEHRLKGIAAPERIFQLCHPDLVTEFPRLNSLAIFKHNLQRQLSTFIGREKELAEIKRLLRDTQLLTLLGPGGTGKTRLMLQVAEEVIDGYPDGVWLVELAPLTDPDLIPERVAAALNIQEQPGRPIIDTVTDYLLRKELLLLLDNVEHLVRESAAITEYLLEKCPKLKILVTGREALFINGETTIQVPSLSMPEEGQFTEKIAKSEGVQLFLERARSVRPDFKINEQNAVTIAEIVRRLDGIPLALELAATRLRMLTVEQINERLNDRFRLLTGGHRTALPRQQTLQALIDWSWQLLDEKERTLLRRLSVFFGGWNLESAQAITGFDPIDELDVFDHLDQLINKSLVTVQYPIGGEARYGMLESIRQFAQDKLFEAGEGQILRDRHVDYFVDFSQEAGRHLRLSTMLTWEERIVKEMDNIRSALAWALDDHPELTLRISAALFYDWAQWIHPSEVLAWLEPSIDKTRPLLNKDNSPVRTEDFIKALYALGFTQALFGNVKLSLEIADEGIQLSQESSELQLYTYGISQKFSGMIQHWFEISEEWLQVVKNAIEICQKEGFELELGRLHLNMGTFLILRGEFEQAKQNFQKAEEIIRKYQNPRSLGLLLFVKAQFALAQGDLETALQIYEQAVETFAAINDQLIVLIAKSTISHFLRRSGKIAEAIPYYRGTILKWQEQGNPVSIAHQLECFAYIGIANEKHKHAAQLLGRASATRKEMNAISKDPQEIAELEQAMTQLADAMGEDERDRWMADGAKMSLDEAVSFALKETP